MSGLWRARPTPRQSCDAATACPLPRSVLRSLIAAARLGVGSRLRIVGDDADAAAAAFEYLGMDAATDFDATVDRNSVDRSCDAAVWIDLNRASPGERSLVSPSAYDRTAALVATLRPQGTLLIVSHLGRMTGGHEPECLERHIQSLPGPSRIEIVPERAFLGFLRENARPSFAIASWRAPHAAIDVESWRRRQASLSSYSASCCRWAAESLPQRRAA